LLPLLPLLPLPLPVEIGRRVKRSAPRTMIAMAMPLGPKQRKHNNTNATAEYFAAFSPRALESGAETDGAL
jgi:hypothetical protein